MKIKLIGRTGESDSPIFFAESLGEQWEDSSESERGRRARKLGLDSETSSLQLGDREDEEEEEEEGSPYDGSSPHASDSEEAMAEGSEDDEHADFCHICKDGGELLCCDVCPLAYHLTCLTPPMVDIPDGEWKCPRCQAKDEPLPGKVERLVTWKWEEYPVKSEGEEELEDDVMADGTDNVEKSTPKKPPQMYRIREFLVKWKGKSYWKCSWVSEMRLDVHRPITLRSFTRRHNMNVPPPNELAPHVRHRHMRRSTASHHDEKMEEQEMMLLKAGIRPAWLLIHRIINKRSKKGKTQYLVKWRELPYEQSTWEDLDSDSYLKGAATAIEEYNQRRHKMDPKKMKKAEKRRGRTKSRTNPAEKYPDQPSFLTGGTLHSYQLEGLNWLRFSWTQHTNTILADEMGLGKTIQTIAFLYSLVREDHSNGPFLIAAPLSTIVNWEREFEIWAPDLYVVTYSGDRENRAVIRENEFTYVEGAIKGGTKLFKMKKDAPTKFHVLLTSYEFISVDATILQSIDWEVLVVDEAHRLKNNQSKFFRVLSTYNLKYKLLLTGTPLQNNLEELFHLLNFLNPDSFNSLEEFQDEFQDISKEEQIQKLHELLAPHLLRRLKQDVLKNIPSKRELIVRVELSPMQKKYYRWILTRNFEKLNSRGSQPVSLLNVMMDLKKCCNHPYLFPTAAQEAPLTATGYYEGKSLVQAGGKFIVLEKMLRELRKQGHRVLIFSQMTRMLDILEDFLDYLGYRFERIDGSVTGPERQQAIDRFNAPGASQFVFLLSTRAGGLGINLATADTVIIYDSDWNPHNDIQAFSRAHRIGQANKVMIYRFVTRNSVEERITEVAKKKMMLTHLVVRPGMGSASSQSLSKRELDDILKFGTEELFKEEAVGNQESISIHYDDEAILALLDRNLVGEEGESEEGQQNILANEYLSSFKVASYVMKEKGEEGEVELETEIIKEEEPQTDPDFWERLLRHHYEQQRELEAAKLGKGKRVRKQVNYLDASGGDYRALDSDQSSYKQSDEEDSEPESDTEEFSVGGKKKPKLPIPMKANSLPPLLSKVNGTIHVLGFTPRQRKAFLNSVMRYGIPPPDSFHGNWKPKELKNVTQPAFNAYTTMFMRHICEPATPDSDSFSDGVPREGLSRQLVLTRIGTMRLVKNKVDQYTDLNGDYSESPPQPSSVIQEPPLKTTPTQNGTGEDSTHKPPSTGTPAAAEDGTTLPTGGKEGAEVKPAREGGGKGEEKAPSEEVGKEEESKQSHSGTAESDSQKSGPLGGSMEPGHVDNKVKVVKEETSMDVDVEGDGVMSDGDKPEPMETSDQQAPDGGRDSTEHKSDGTKESESSKSSPQETGQAGKTQQEQPQQPAEDAKPAKKETSEGKPKESVIINPPPPSASSRAQATTPSKSSRFMFNIADGGFTELHTLWAEEKTKGFRSSVWGRHHDYWLLKGIVTHGYCRWTEICGDQRFSLLNKAFAPQSETVSDPKSRFLLKRFKLLEQALAVEEQLHRASNAGLVQDPNKTVMQLHSRFTDLDCLADGHLHLVKECMAGNVNSQLLMRKALGKIEDLLVEMKADISRLSSELNKIPSVSKQLKMDEISTLTKMAQKGAVASSSVITQAPPNVTVTTPALASSVAKTKTSNVTSIAPKGSGQKESVVIQESSKRKSESSSRVSAANSVTSYPVTGYTTSAGTLVPVAGGSGLTLQTAEGLIVAGGVQYATIQTSKSHGNTATANDQTSYTVFDGNQVYQTATVQLVPVSTGQQVMVWPSVLQQGKSTPQLTVVQGSQLLSMAVDASQVQTNTTSAGSGTTASIITID